jgi:hypothetical protein
VTVLAGCGTAAAPVWSEPPDAGPDDPVAVIQRAMEKSLSSTFAMKAGVTIGAGQAISLEGRADPAAGVLTVSGRAPEPVEARMLGDVVYIKQDAGAAKAWMRVRLAKLRPNSALRQSFDIEAQTGIVGGIATAEPAGEGRFRGTADLTKAAAAAGSDSLRDSLESVAALAKAPTAIPYEVALDAQGRLTELHYTVATASMGEFRTDVEMSGFGEPVKVPAPPAAQIEDAPDEAYAFL